MNNITKMFSELERILPPKMLDELRGLGDMLEQVSWKAAWLTDEIYKRVKAAKLNYDIMTVCWMVSEGFLHGHLSANSLRAYLVTARFFPPVVAMQYHNDVLPMSTFTLAQQVDGQYSEKLNQTVTWKDVLEWAFDEYNQSGTGRPPSKAKTMEHFFGSKKGTEKPFAVVDSEPMGAAVLPVEVAEQQGAVAVVASFMSVVNSLTPYIRLLSGINPKAGPFVSGIILQLQNFGQEAMQVARKKDRELSRD